MKGTGVYEGELPTLRRRQRLGDRAERQAKVFVPSGAQGTSDSPAAYSTGNNRTEIGITKSSKPATVDPTDDQGALSAGTWTESDVKQLVKGDGTYRFVIRSTSSNGVDFDSREATTTANRPELVVSFSPWCPGVISDRAPRPL